MRLLFFVLICVLVCGGRAIHVLRGKYGHFFSPKFPQVYDNFLDVEWRIEVREGYRIKLRFTDFDLEDSYEEGNGSCIYDYVLITEGEEVVRRFCGNDFEWPYNAPWPNKWIWSKKNVLTVKFVSDYSNEGLSPTGFAAHYVEKDIDECAVMRQKELYLYDDWDKLVTCSHFCNNIPGSYYCSCRKRFHLHSNNHTCVAKFCENRKLRGERGVIQSPDYPNPYSKLTHCSWDVLVRDGLFLHFTFDREFEIEDPVDNVCGYDVLKLEYNGTSDPYCGNAAPNNGTVMDMNTRHVTVKFDTDLSIEMKGFKITYHITKIRCLKVLNDPVHGYISSQNPKDYYEFEDVVLFECRQGYELQGGSSLECLSNGKWNQSEPSCQIKSCGRPDNLAAVRHSSIVDIGTKNFTFGEVITVKCDPWYELAGGTNEWRCEDEKQWVRHDNGSMTTMPSCRPRCGHRLITEDKIGGHASDGKKVKKYGGWPWMAFIDKGAGRAGNTFCGGSLIDEKTVVTAAHCLYDIDAGDTVDVWLGLLNRKNDNFNFTQKFTVPYEKFYLHDNFRSQSGESYDSDIAVMKLDHPAKLSRWVHPICVPSNRAQKDLPELYRIGRKNAVVTGWGTTEHGSTSLDLLKIRIPFVDKETCRSSYQSRFGNKEMVTENMLCAGFSSGERDTCKGDSGGPLMTSTDGNPPQWYLSGVVSFGDESKVQSCGHADAYGVYTDVGKFEEFLSSRMEE